MSNRMSRGLIGKLVCHTRIIEAAKRRRTFVGRCFCPIFYIVIMEFLLVVEFVVASAAQTLAN